MKPLLILMLGIVIGGFAGITAMKLMSKSVNPDTENIPIREQSEPLYWVAPMDSNYRRDKPGKSPMGMDLVPVFANQASPGTVLISPDVENNLGVRTTKVKQEALHVPINTVGYIQYNQDKLVHIHPRVEGWVDSLYVKATGEPVTKGQALYALYSPQLVNAQEEYLLASNRNNASLISASIQRLKALQMPDSAIELLSTSKKVQQTIQFIAPQSGVINNLNIREGFFVKPGTTMMSIGSLDEVWVEAEIFERQVSLVKTGLRVSMTLDFLPGEQWQGVVDYIYPALDPKTRTLRVRLRFVNPKRRLKPNMFAQVTIHSDLNETSLLVPTEAVIRTGKQDRVVLHLGEGKYKSVEVSLGQVTSNFSQILQGLKAGDEVVSSAQFLLDSESSISSDFQRMSHESSETPAFDDAESWAIVSGKINQINEGAHTLNISRGPIDKWGRGPATMDFLLGPELNTTQFFQDQQIRFRFEIQGDEFVIVSVEDERL